MSDRPVEAASFRLHKLLSGSIMVLALLTVLEGDALTEWNAMATIFLALATQGVADAFARGLADEIARRRRPTFGEAGALLRSSLIVVAPGIVPALAFAAVAAGWLALDTAFVWACWLLVFALFAAGFRACVVAGGSAWRALLHGAIVSSLGLGIVALRLMVR